MKRLYVAYGSNLNISQMASRCPNASIYSTGVINNCEMIFRGSKTGSHATIRICKGKSVPVLVWAIDSASERSLDIYEGFPHYYVKESILVTVDGIKIRCMAYIMDKNKKPGIPSEQYIDTIKTGYLDNGFDVNILNEFIENNKRECV